MKEDDKDKNTPKKRVNKSKRYNAPTVVPEEPTHKESKNRKFKHKTGNMLPLKDIESNLARYQDDIDSLKGSLYATFVKSDNEYLEELTLDNCSQIASAVVKLAAGAHYLDAVESEGLTHAKIGLMSSFCHEFKALMAEAQEIGGQIRQHRRERALDERAVDGWQVPIFNKAGMKVGEETKYSDRLLELALKANSDKYKEKTQVDHNVKGVVFNIQAPAPIIPIDKNTPSQSIDITPDIQEETP